MFAKGYRTMTSGGDTVFRKIWPGAGFKAGDFVKE